MDQSDHPHRLHNAGEASGQDDRVADSFQDDSAEVITELESFIEASTDSEEKQRRRKLVGLLQGKYSLRGGRVVVRGNLDLENEGLWELLELPDICSVEGNLIVCSCGGLSASLTALPEGLNVIGDLSLRGCSGLTALPEDLNVTGNLHLSDCSSLTALPED